MTVLQYSSRSCKKQQKAASWRDVVRIHPAADIFPLIPAYMLRDVIGADIRKCGLKVPIVFLRTERRGSDGSLIHGKYDLELLDGRNRLDAMEREGFQLVDADGELDPWLGHDALGLPAPKGNVKHACWDELNSDSSDAYALVGSLNGHRRHLTVEQKREALVKLLKAQPEKSDRQIGKMATADNKTVAAVRSDLERREEIPHVSTRTDTKGRQQPANKGTAKPAAAAPVTVTPITTAIVAQPSEATMAVAQITQLAHAMIAFEATRVGGPVSKELVELMGRASAAWAELTKRLMRQVQIAPPPIDNEIPDFLRRGPLPHIDEGATP